MSCQTGRIARVPVNRALHKGRQVETLAFAFASVTFFPAYMVAFLARIEGKRKSVVDGPA